MPKRKLKVYCAGPMFSPGELLEMRTIANELEKAGFATFLPQRDGLEIRELLNAAGHPSDPQTILAVQLCLVPVRHAIFALDLYQVVAGTDCLVININGAVPDGGSIVEAATARMAGKPVIIFKQTPITFIAGDDSPLIDGLSHEWINVLDFKQIAPALKRAIKTQQPCTPAIPPVPQHDIELGEAIWKVKRSIEWRADVGQLIANMPALVKGQAAITVDDKGVIRLGDGFVLAERKAKAKLSLQELRDGTERLWQKFCELAAEAGEAAETTHKARVAARKRLAELAIRERAL